MAASTDSHATAGADERAATDERLIGLLRERRMRVTAQRLIINRALHELDTHVTAEALLAEVGDRLPGISLPTVYATLELFEELGAVNRVAVPGGPALYDPRTTPHHHLVCRSCGKTEDIDAPVELEPLLAAAAKHGFTSRRGEIVVTGLCGDCTTA